MAKSDNYDHAASKLMIEECFEAQDDRFVSEFRRNLSAKYLAIFADRWLKDPRPWARDQILAYLQADWSPLNHDVVYKRIFKHFYSSADHEMMGVLMCQTDRLVRRNRVKQWHYDRKTQQSWTTERLYAKSNKVNRWQHGKRAQTNRLFSHRTRNYLRRAAWRYFRRLSHTAPDVYVVQISKALQQYEDRDFESGENLIDNWSLMHACFYHHDAISFTASHTNLAKGHSLDELEPSPYQTEVWTKEEVRTALLGLIVDAQSSLVRIWAMDLFLQHHKKSVGTIDLSLLLRMMSSPDERLQEFAGQAFDSHPELPTLTVEKWLQLLDESAVGQLPRLCEAMKKYVAEERLDAVRLLRLSCARQVPVAELGFDYLQNRDQQSPLSASQLVGLADCQSAQQASRITQWALDRISERDDANIPDLTIGFFDSLLKPTRTAAMDWLAKPDSPGYRRAKLWAMLVETPFDDVKLRMIDLLHQRAEKDENETSSLSPVWVAVILGVNRGGRTKPKALNQLADEIIRNPEAAGELLPVLAVAVRSVRNPEMRYGLAEVVRIVESRPEMTEAIEQVLPEIEFEPAEGSSWT